MKGKLLLSQSRAWGAGGKTLSSLIRRLAPVAFLLITVAPLVLLAYYSVTVTSGALTREAESGAASVAGTNATYIEQRFNGLADTLQEFGQNSITASLSNGNRASYDLPGISADLDRLLALHNGPEQAFVADATGTLVAVGYTEKWAGKTTMTDEGWYGSVVRANKPYVSGLGVIGGRRDPSTVAIATPLWADHPAGTNPTRAIGYLVGAYSITWASDLVDKFARTQDVSLTLMDQKGDVMVTPESLRATVTELGTDDPLLRAAQEGRSGVTQRQGPKGDVFTAYTPLQSLGWTLVVDVSARDPLSILANLKNTVVVVDALLAMVLLGGMVLGIHLLRRAQQSAVLQERNEVMRRLDDAARTVHSLRGQPALDKLAATAGELVGAEFSWVTVLRPGSQELEAVAHADVSATSKGASIVTDLLNQRFGPDRSARLGDIGEFHALAEIGALPTLGPLATVPLLAGSEVLGRLVVARQVGEATFDDNHEGLLRQLAQHAVTAIQKKRQDEEREAFVEELRDKNEELVTASRLKSEFLANMSHELRTPLSAIIGFSDLLIDGTDGELNGEQFEDVCQIQRAGRTLLGLINDILDLSKIEAGGMTLEMEDNDLVQVIRDVVASVRPLAEARSIHLLAELPENSELHHCDEIRVRQVLTNLVSNAIKFTAQGGVTIRYEERGGAAEISVIDTGIGIPPHALGLIFEQFTQAESGTTRKFGGTGLGLAISRKLIELQGGEIGVESTEGWGSRFWFRVRRSAPADGAREPDTVPELVTMSSAEGALDEPGW